MKSLRSLATLLAVLIALTSFAAPLAVLAEGDGGAPAQTQAASEPTKAPKQEAPKEATQAPTAGPTKAPTAEPTQAPKEQTTEAPAKEQNSKVPETTTQAPETTTQAPENTTQAPETTTQAPENTTQAPETTTQAPETTTQAPENTTQAPETTTQAPETTTPAPETTTQAPPTDAPTTSPEDAAAKEKLIQQINEAANQIQSLATKAQEYATAAKKYYDDANSKVANAEKSIVSSSASDELKSAALAYIGKQDASGTAKAFVAAALSAYETAQAKADEAKKNAQSALNTAQGATADKSQKELEEIKQQIEALSQPTSLCATDAGYSAEAAQTAMQNAISQANRALSMISSGAISIGRVEVPSVKVGKNVTLAIPLVYTYQGTDLYSNLKAGTNQLLAYSPDNPLNAYDPAITQRLVYAKFTLDTTSMDTLPFNLKEQGLSYTLIGWADDEVAKKLGVQPKAYYNRGYAVFSGLTVKKSLPNGTYPVIFNVEWKDVASDVVHTDQLSTYIRVTGAKSSSGGGGGGGGGGGVTSPGPQAKLIIDSVDTDPTEVKAGDKFDLILKLRNTSEKQYVQNIRLTMTPEDDALIPESGSTSTYIKKIDKNSTYEMRIPVSCRPDIADKPLKIEFSMEFEDKALTAQTVSQSMILNVKQLQRIKLDEPVLPTESAMVNEGYTLSMGVFNLGRTTLYNVTVKVVPDSPQLNAGQSFYCGNMEPGSSKTAEIDVTPLEEGEFSGKLEVTFEDANGEESTESKTFTLFANGEDMGGMDEPIDDFPTDLEPTPAPVTTWTILGMLPWWLYAAVGVMFLALILSMATSARRRRRKALEDDEMD